MIVSGKILKIVVGFLLIFFGVFISGNVGMVITGLGSLAIGMGLIEMS